MRRRRFPRMMLAIVVVGTIALLSALVLLVNEQPDAPGLGPTTWVRRRRCPPPMGI
jgi:hypothetical protein